MTSPERGMAGPEPGTSGAEPGTSGAEPGTASPSPDHAPGLDGPDSSAPGPTEPASPTGAGATDPDAPLRVTTLELFFDLVFAFTLTQLASLLVHQFRPSGALEVLLVFGVLWWMYGGYAWLTNTRAPNRTPERLLLLVGMAGFLICGLAIPHGLGPGDTGTRVALGL